MRNPVDAPCDHLGLKGWEGGKLGLKRGPQPVYFSQWSFTQDMPDHSWSVTPVISPDGLTVYVA